MNLERIAGKQKRLRTWLDLLEEFTGDEATRLEFQNNLKSYRNLLSKCWENGAVTEEDEATLDDLERSLELYCGELRLAAATEPSTTAG